MATFTVTSLSDVTDATDGVLTLREAAALANATAGADTIDFDTGVGGAIEGGGLIRLVQGEIELIDAVTIDGARAITLTGDANGDDVLDANGLTDIAASSGSQLSNNSRILKSTSGTLALEGLTLTGGGSANTDFFYGGGAVLVDGFTSTGYGLTVRISTFAGNTSFEGGAITTYAPVLIEGSEFIGNRSSGGADTFLFETGDGQGIGDQIIDFEIGVDTIDLSAKGLGFSDLSITDAGPNATISYGTDTITVFNTTAAQLDQIQFDFAP